MAKYVVLKSDDTRESTWNALNDGSFDDLLEAKKCAESFCKKIRGVKVFILEIKCEVEEQIKWSWKS